MGFLRALRDFLTDRARHDVPDAALDRLRDAWGLDDGPDAEAGATAEESPAAPGPDAAAASAYDQANWRRKLHTIVEKFPGSREEWPDLVVEARALQLDDAWVQAAVVEEFTMMIRGFLADRRLTEDEADRIRAVREMVGLGEERAAAVVREVVADAERFFGQAVVEE